MKNLTKHIAFLLLLTFIASCEPYLDINPDSEVTSEEIFSTAQGVEDALYGIYAELNNSDLYGERMAWAIPEVLSQDLNPPSSTLWDNFSRYNYTALEDPIKQLWKETYRIIGYTNNIIGSLEAKEPSQFEFQNLYLGEAYGLRGFLHFELLKYFAPHIENGNAGAEGIPYATQFSFEYPPFLTVGETYDAIIADLEKAQSLLEQGQGILSYPRTFQDAGLDDFINGRILHFNYYAATAMLARVLRMKGDLERAAVEAEKIINSGKFPLSSPDEVPSMLAGVLSRKETIWGTYDPELIEVTKRDFNTSNSYETFFPYHRNGDSNSNEQTYEDVFSKYQSSDAGTDYRLNWFSLSESGQTVKFLKFFDGTLFNSDISPESRGLYPGFSLIRISEMYYIAAEAALVSGNKEKAATYINAVLNSRGLVSLEDRATPINLDLDFLYNERHKDFFGEGRRWFDMKKRNLSIPSNVTSEILPPSDELYVFPIPIEEYKYRNR